MADPTPPHTSPATLPGAYDTGVRDSLKIRIDNSDYNYTVKGSEPAVAPDFINITDSNNAVVHVKCKDIVTTVNLRVIGKGLDKPLPNQAHCFPMIAPGILTYRGEKYLVTNISEAGTAEGETVWTIQISRWMYWPTPTTTTIDWAAIADLPITAPTVSTTPPVI